MVSSHIVGFPNFYQPPSARVFLLEDSGGPLKAEEGQEAVFRATPTVKGMPAVGLVSSAIRWLKALLELQVVLCVFSLTFLEDFS